MEAMSLVNGATTEKRRELDFYPTPPDVTHALMAFLNWTPRAIWEPACGDGAMSRILAEYGHRVTSTDLRDSGYGEGNVDFLKAERQCDAIITNPPFSISEEFIRHALKQTPAVAMLLKSQYWHAKKRLTLFQERPPTYVLPLTWRPDFMNGERGGAPTMEVCWSVWGNGTSETRYVPLARP